MMTSPSLVTRRLALAVASLGLVGCAAMSGCQTSYAADVRNSSPQPVYAQLMEEFDNGATPRAAIRLGPGDRGGLGPIVAREGRAFLVVDTVPNPGAPISLGLASGTTIVEVTQQGEQMTGPIELKVIGGTPPPQPQLPPPPQPGHSN